MSYPRQVSVLVVEDDMGPKDLYEQIFSKELPKQGYSAWLSLAAVRASGVRNRRAE
jgi:hypothetical protein